MKNEIVDDLQQLEEQENVIIPILTKLKMIDLPFYDFHEAVFKMEDLFIEMEKEIDPIKCALFDHVAFDLIDKEADFSSIDRHRLLK